MLKMMIVVVVFFAFCWLPINLILVAVQEIAIQVCFF